MFSLIPPIEIEAGVMGPQAQHSDASGYVSVNGAVPVGDAGNRFGFPVLLGGYTRMFETGHALDYGVGFAHPIDPNHTLQFEVRDYWTFARPDQHNVVFRVVWMVGWPD